METQLNWFSVTKRVVLLGILLSLLETIFGLQTETTFNGTQYIAYPIPSHEMGSTYDRIVVDFKTARPYGVILYSGGTQGDFVSLEVIRGKLR